MEVLLDEKAAKLHIPALIAVPRNLSERELLLVGVSTNSPVCHSLVGTTGGLTPREDADREKHQTF